MAQQLLDRPDVVAILQKMRSERVPQGVTPRVLVDAHRPHRPFHRPLHRRLIEMMPPLDPAPRVYRQPRRGKQILPAELRRGVRVLSLQSVRQPDLTRTRGQILPVNPAHHLDLSMQRLLETLREHRAEVLRPLPCDCGSRMSTH